MLAPCWRKLVCAVCNGLLRVVQLAVQVVVNKHNEKPHLQVLGEVANVPQQPHLPLLMVHGANAVDVPHKVPHKQCVERMRLMQAPNCVASNVAVSGSQPQLRVKCNPFLRKLTAHLHKVSQKLPLLYWTPHKQRGQIVAAVPSPKWAWTTRAVLLVWRANVPFKKIRNTVKV